MEPRIYGTQIKTVKLSNSSKCALVIWIPRSFNPPHMVIIDGHRKFYGRNSSGKYPLSVYDLRIIFGLADEITKRAREFCYDRIFKIKSGQTPVPLLEGPKYVLHLIPFGSFKPDSNYDLSEFYKDPKKLPNIRLESTTHGWGKYNFDGFASYWHFEPYNPTKPISGYTQIFRNGIIEAVGVEYNPTLNGKVDKVVDINYKDTIIKAIKEYLGIQKTLGITPPIFIIFSILGVKGIQIGQRDSCHKLKPIYGSEPFPQDDLILPEIIPSDFDDNKVEQQIHQIFNIVLNAASITREDIR
jgi:hypothetical protein